jgi:hypothetical protein
MAPAGGIIYGYLMLDLLFLTPRNYLLEGGQPDSMGGKIR